MIINALFYGGDLWFAYTLYIIFLFLIPVRNLLKNRWVVVGLIAILIVVYFLDFLPSIFALDKVFRYMVFFVSGYALSEKYSKIKNYTLKWRWVVYLVAILANCTFVEFLLHLKIVFGFILPFTGTLAVMTLAFRLENIIDKSKVVKYIEYVGKYSLQFYLFPFFYPIIRMVIVSIMHITNPFIILISVFVLQLITTTLIVEVTRRIKWLKIPCGY